MSNEQKLMELLSTMEDLDPELEDYMFDDGPFGPSIKHPLVFSIVHSPATNAFVNAQLKQKKAALERATAEKNWSTYVWLHERPWRLDAFMDIRDYLADEKYWSLAGTIWVDSENIFQNLDEWRDLLENPERGDRHFFMEEDDREFLTLTPSRGGLPPVFTVYRGFSVEGAEDGFSWTLDQEKAGWFAQRLCHSDETPTVATGTLGYRDVIAYMSGRGEREIVCLPENVCGIEFTVL